MRCPVSNSFIKIKAETDTDIFYENINFAGKCGVLLSHLAADEQICLEEFKDQNLISTEKNAILGTRYTFWKCASSTLPEYFNSINQLAMNRSQKILLVITLN